MKIRYIEKTLTATEFNTLTESVVCGTRENSIVEEALKNTLYSLCVYDEDKLIGYGRIIGDKTIFLYIQDIMAIPEYQDKQIGTGNIKVSNLKLTTLDYETKNAEDISKDITIKKKHKKQQH